MIITVFGATGQVGKQVVKQALLKEHTVKAFGRNVGDFIDEDLKNDNLEAMQGHIFDEVETFDALEGADAVISTLGGAFDGTDKTRSLGIKNIIAQMKKAGVTRIIALGGMGVLNDGNGGYLIDQSSYPADYKPVGREHLQAYLFLKESGLDFTFVCSPNIVNADATGNYITNANYPPQPDKGEITAGDLADFMLKELEVNKFVQQRVGISKS